MVLSQMSRAMRTKRRVKNPQNQSKLLKFFASTKFQNKTQSYHIQFI